MKSPFINSLCKIWVNLITLKKKCYYTTDIKRRSRNSYTAQCNGVISHGAPIGGIWVFVEHTWKQTKSKMHPRSPHMVRRVTHVYLYAQTALTNHGYFDRGRNPNTPKWSPNQCWDKDGAASVISGLYLCIILIIQNSDKEKKMSSGKFYEGI